LPLHRLLSADSFETFDLPRTATLNHLTSVLFSLAWLHSVDYTTPSPLANGDRSPGVDRALRSGDRGRAAIRVPGTRVTAVTPDASGVRPLLAAASCGLGSRACLRAPPTSFNGAWDSALPTSYLQTAQSARCRRGIRETSSSISARTSRPSGSPGRCRSCGRGAFVRIA